MSFDHKTNISPYTEKEGQYLAFIHYYTKLNRRPPAQKDIQRYFEVTPPSVHQMILRLEKKNLIHRVPLQSRALSVSLPDHLIPPLK